MFISLLTPLAALQHRAASVLGAIVGIPGAMQIVPEEQAALLGLDEQRQKGKRCGAACLHIR